jgi:DNA-damage-inducible protein D
MKKNDIIESTYNTFESLKHVDENGTEFWYAHDLSKALGYSQFQQFRPAIERAQESIASRGIDPNSHIRECKEEFTNGAGAKVGVNGYMMTRAGAYATAMNGDPRKAEIGAVQGYFMDSANTLESMKHNADALAYIANREILKDTNKHLSDTLESHDVPRNRISQVLNKGHEGLFGMTNNELKEKYNIPASTNVVDVLGSDLASIKNSATVYARARIENYDIRGEEATSKVVYDEHRIERERYQAAFRKNPEDALPAENVNKVITKRNKSINTILKNGFDQ